MTVTFKTCTSNPKTAEKEFDQREGKTIEVPNVQPFERLDDLTGTLILEYNDAIEASNYCEFEGMKYFITGKARDIGERLVLTLKLDALSTYWGQIKKCEAIVRTTTQNDDKDKLAGWTRLIQGDRMIYSYQVTHATPPYKSELDFDEGHFYMGIYG